MVYIATESIVESGENLLKVLEIADLLKESIAAGHMGGMY